MKFVKLNSGYDNAACIDLDRVMSFQWFNTEDKIKGTFQASIEIVFFGRNEIKTYNFKNIELAKACNNQLSIALCVEPIDVVAASVIAKSLP